MNVPLSGLVMESATKHVSWTSINTMEETVRRLPRFSAISFELAMELVTQYAILNNTHMTEGIVKFVTVVKHESMMGGVTLPVSE